MFISECIKKDQLIVKAIPLSQTLNNTANSNMLLVKVRKWLDIWDLVLILFIGVKY